MLNRKLVITPIAAAIALALWGCGPDADKSRPSQSNVTPPAETTPPPRIAQSPSTTAPAERQPDSANPSGGMQDRNPGFGNPSSSSAPGAAPVSPENRSLQSDEKNAREPAVPQSTPGNPPASRKDKNNND